MQHCINECHLTAYSSLLCADVSDQNDQVVFYIANDGPVLNGFAVKTPVGPAPRELNSVQHTVPMKRSASSNDVAVDERHQSSTSYQSSAMHEATSASDLRYVRRI